MILMGLVMVFPLLGILLFFMLPLREALPIYIVLTGVSGFLHWVMMRSMRLPSRTGGNAMIGTIGVVLHWDGGSGQVRWRNEIWQAESQNGKSLAGGDQVVVDSLAGLTLAVRPLDARTQEALSRDSAFSK